ncbi:MAG: flippase-like domain-containing protein [Chloroflexi bacterium]|nr:flippase-like domain-containing protein [Chloroflexota bacterium]
MRLGLYYFRNNPWAGWILRLAFSVIMLILLFIQVDFMTVFATLSQINWAMLGPIIILLFTIRFIWAYQMSLVLAPLHMKFSLLHLVKINFISSFYSLILPGNLIAGGAVSWYKLSQPNSQGAEALAVLIHFRLVGILTLLGLGLIGAWFDPHLAVFPLRVIVVVMFGGVVLLLLPFFSPTVTFLIERLGYLVLGRLPLPGWVQSKGQKTWQAFLAFQKLKKRVVVLVLGLSLLSHIVGVVNQYLFALAININLSIFVMGWIRALLGILQMIPISLAGIGLREGSLVFLLHDYNVPQAQALSFSLLIFSSYVVAGVLGGILEAWDLLRIRHSGKGSISPQEVDATP